MARIFYSGTLSGCKYRSTGDVTCLRLIRGGMNDEKSDDDGSDFGPVGRVASACTTYERQVVPFKMPAAYPNATAVADATIAAKAYDNGEEASAAFGFDIRGAGILPVQVIFDNTGNHPLEILSDKTLLVDEENNLWPILDERMAYDRLQEDGTRQGGARGREGGLLAGAAGAVIGAAIGIVTGTNVASAAGKGGRSRGRRRDHHGRGQGAGRFGCPVSDPARISGSGPSKRGRSPRTRWPTVSSSIPGRPRDRRNCGSASGRRIRNRSIR